ncbi:MAG: hypothetical protein AAGG02_09975 [Cyanobacteria bacterium P01_H01_bin.15]
MSSSNCLQLQGGSGSLPTGFALISVDLELVEANFPSTPTPLVAQADFLDTDSDAIVMGNIFVDNGNGADTGDGLQIIEINAQGFPVNDSFGLPSGALLTVMADGNVSYDPNGQFDYLDEG